MYNILLVEDNADMHSLLRDLLEWGGHAVLSGRTGQEALDVLQKIPQAPDVIISDLTMPQMDGITFLSHVRQNPAWEGVRFILMSANPHDARLKTDAVIGANGVLPKPFSLEDLTQLLETN